MFNRKFSDKFGASWQSLVPRGSDDLNIDAEFDINLLSGCPHIKRAVQQISDEVQVPVDMALMSIISSISLVSQSQIDVRRPGGLVGPVSIFSVTVANSGLRKTVLENLVYVPIKDFERSGREKYSENCEAYNVSHDLWCEKFKTLQKKTAKLDAFGSEYLKGEEELKALIMVKPKKPKHYRLLFDDSTPEALFSAMCDGALNVGLISSEGVSILNGRAFKDHAKLNSLWSGSDIIVDRVKLGERFLSGARLTTSIMVQEDIFLKYIEVKGCESRSVGLWARALICRPIPNQGKRLMDGLDKNKESCKWFLARIAELLDRTLPDGEARSVLNFNDEAAAYWVDIYNFIEFEMRPGGVYSGVLDSASKKAENIARVAANLAFFERGQADITAADVEVAAAICFWCSRFFMHYFAGLSDDEKNAESLELWLEDKTRKVYDRPRKSDARRSGYGGLRDNKRLDRAIAVLESRGRLKVTTVARTKYLDLIWPSTERP